MKGIPLARCRARVQRLSHKMVDTQSSVRRRLALLFDGFCKREAEWMGAYEFTSLCHAPLQHVVFQCFIAVSSSAKTTNLYVPEVFSAGDAFKIFYETPGLVNQRMDFGGFMHAICEVGLLFGKNQKEAGEMFAAAVGHLACKGFCICFLE
eukprot:g13072.t1